MWISALLWVLQKLHGNHCLGTWSPSSPSFFSHLSVHRLFPQTFFLPNSSKSWAAFLTFLKYVFPEASLSEMLGHALPGIYWSWLKLTVPGIGQVLASPHRDHCPLCEFITITIHFFLYKDWYPTVTIVRLLARNTHFVGGEHKGPSSKAANI